MYLLPMPSSPTPFFEWQKQAHFFKDSQGLVWVYSWHCDSFLLVSGIFPPSVFNRKAVGQGAAQGDEDGRHQDVHGVLKTEVAVGHVHIK